MSGIEALDYWGKTIFAWSANACATIIPYPQYVPKCQAVAKAMSGGEDSLSIRSTPGDMRAKLLLVEDRLWRAALAEEKTEEARVKRVVWERTRSPGVYIASDGTP